MYKLPYGKGQFKHLTFNCDLDFGHTETFSHDTTTCYGEQVCEVCLKSIDKCRSNVLNKVSLNI